MGNREDGEEWVGGVVLRGGGWGEDSDEAASLELDQRVRKQKREG